MRDLNVISDMIQSLTEKTHEIFQDDLVKDYARLMPGEITRLRAVISP